MYSLRPWCVVAQIERYTPVRKSLVRQVAAGRYCDGRTNYAVGAQHADREVRYMKRPTVEPAKTFGVPHDCLYQTKRCNALGYAMAMPAMSRRQSVAVIKRRTDADRCCFLADA